MDDEYYKTGFEYPLYLQKSIDDLVWAEDHDLIALDCYESDFINSVNIAFCALPAEFSVIFKPEASASVRIFYVIGIMLFILIGTYEIGTVRIFKESCRIIVCSGHGPLCALKCAASPVNGNIILILFTCRCNADISSSCDFFMIITCEIRCLYRCGNLGSSWHFGIRCFFGNGCHCNAGNLGSYYRVGNRCYIRFITSCNTENHCGNESKGK